MDLIGKTVLITGANSGMGFKMVETMAYLGASVVMVCRKMEKDREGKAIGGLSSCRYSHPETGSE